MFQKRVLFIVACFLSIIALPAAADHASVGLGVGTAAPISTETAVTLPEGKWAVGIRSEYVKLDSFPITGFGNYMKRMRKRIFTASVRYGVILWEPLMGLPMISW